MSHVADMNCEGFSDSESKLLESVDHRCWGRVGVSVETPCLREFPIMVGKFEDAFWDLEVCVFLVHQSGVGFYWCECDRVRGLGFKEKGLEDWYKASEGIYCYGDQDHIAIEAVANDGITSGGGVCNFVGFVFASNLLFFLFL